jgi:choline dehydrogenase
VLGGSSSVNAMIYIRGNRADYDGWGQPGWGWDDIFPYFLKAEDNERGASEWHGAGGPLPVSDQRSGNRITPAFVEAGVEAGLDRNDDFNAANQDGVGMYQLTQRGGMRASAAVAYLHPAMERPNLTVMPYMHVNRVLFEGRRAVGVEASQLGQAQELRAEREVILCGGAYNSPQLLMLSGVGPAEHLAMREIELLLDQPAVGENLSDHAAHYEVWTTPEPESLLAALEPAALEEFAASQTGPFASNLAESGGFARVEAGAEAPDTQIHVAPIHIVEEGLGDPQAHGVWISPCLLTPNSRGSVRLASKDPTAKPVIRNGFYAAGGRHRACDRGAAAGAGGLRPAGDAPLLCRSVHGAGRRLRRGPARPRRRHHLSDLPPGRDLRDRLRGRRRAAGRGPRGRARRRRLRDAGGPTRQHQRADDRDRRARRRPDQG